jgi:hypothetical protein
MNDKEDIVDPPADKLESAKDTDKTNEGSPQISETKADAPMGLYGWASSWITSFSPFGRSRNNSTVTIENVDDDKKEKVSSICFPAKANIV